MNMSQLYSQQRATPEKPMKLDQVFLFFSLVFPPADWKEEMSSAITFTVYMLWAGVCILV